MTSKVLGDGKQAQQILQTNGQSMHNPDSLSDGYCLDVTDEAHVVEQVQSFAHEEKTLCDKEREMKDLHHLRSDVDVDLQKERQQKQIEVDQSLDEFEKNRERTKQYERRVDKNIQTMQQAHDMQINRLRAIQADFIAKAGSQDSQELSSYASQKFAVLNNANSLSSLISMAINDAMMNAGKDKTHEETHVGEQDSLLGPTKGRQKSIVINGAIVTLDEDIAHAIERQRSPLTASKPSLRKYQAAEGVSNEVVKELNKTAKKIIKEVEREQREIQKEVQRMDKMVQKSAFEQRYQTMEQMMFHDRYDINSAWDVPKPMYQSQSAYNYNYALQSEQERMMDTRPKRPLPSLRWGELQMQEERLPNGRQLPQLSYQAQLQQQYER